MQYMISKNCGHAQSYYYDLNLDTRSKKYFTRKAWAKALVDMGLGIWDDRSKLNHGRTKYEQRRIKRDRVLIKVRRCFEKRDRVMGEYTHLFDR